MKVKASSLIAAALVFLAGVAYGLYPNYIKSWVFASSYMKAYTPQFEYISDLTKSKESKNYSVFKRTLYNEKDFKGVVVDCAEPFEGCHRFVIGLFSSDPSVPVVGWGESLGVGAEKYSRVRLCISDPAVGLCKEIIQALYSKKPFNLESIELKELYREESASSFFDPFAAQKIAKLPQLRRLEVFNDYAIGEKTQENLTHRHFAGAGTIANFESVQLKRQNELYGPVQFEELINFEVGFVSSLLCYDKNKSVKQNLAHYRGCL